MIFIAKKKLFKNLPGKLFKNCDKVETRPKDDWHLFE